MDGRKYLLILAFVAAFFYRAKAQSVQSLEQADSVSKTLYLAGDWKQLIILGDAAIDAGFDFPALRQKLGYAHFITGNYSRALADYKNVLHNDSFDQNSRYYAYLCNRYLNHDLQASYQAERLDTNQLHDEKIHPFGLVSAGLESGLKFPGDSYRKTAFYSRISLSNRLSWRLQLEQSIVYFNQYINDTKIPGDRRFDNFVPIIGSNDRQTEYYAKLSYALTKDIALIGAYHYLNTGYEDITYNSNVGVAGLKYTGTHFDIQGDFNWAYMIDRHLVQYNAGLFLYPLGNLNFYTISRLSYLNQNDAGQTIFAQSVGFKLVKNTWLETSATFGNLDNYIDTDGLYIYNTIDASKLKLGETAFYQAGRHAQLQLNYTFEKKQDDGHNINYNQHAVTAGIIWKF